MRTFRPTIQNRALLAFAALLVLAGANFVLGELVLSRVARVSETVVWTSELYKLARRIATSVQPQGSAGHADPARSAKIHSALDAEIAAVRLPADMTHLSEDAELRMLWAALVADWERVRKVYLAMRSADPATPGAEPAAQAVREAGTELEASIGAVNYVSVRQLDALNQRVRVMMYIIAPLDLMVVGLIFAGLRRRVVRPLAALSQAARNYSAEGYAQQFRIDSPDEIGELASALNRSATQVQSLIARVRQDADTIRLAESKFRSLVDQCSVGVFLVQDDAFCYVNRQFAEVLGSSAEALVGGPSVLETVVPDDRALVRREVRRNLMGESPTSHYECRLRKSDGSIIQCEIYQSRTDYEGRPAFIGTLIDLTERRRAEEQLRTLSRAIEQSPATVVITDRAGVITYVNPRCTKLTGYTPQEAIGQTPRLFRSGLTPPEVYADLWKAVLDGREWSGEILNRKKSGELFWEHMIASAVRDPEGHITHFVAVKEDITARKLADRELRRLNRTLKVLSECNQAMVHAQSEESLLEATARQIVLLGGYRFAYVGLANDPRGESVRVAAAFGDDAGYLELWSDADRGRGPSGACIRARAASIARDIETDPGYAPWREAAIRRGIRSSIALPLIGDTGAIGALRIFSREKDAFGVEDVKLLSELADDLAFGIQSLRIREERRQAMAALEDSEERFRSISASAQDAIVMVDSAGRIGYWNSAAERMFGVAGERMLGQPALARLIAPESLALVQRALADLEATGRSNLIGRIGEIRAVRHDGTPFPAEVSSSAVRIGGAWHLVAVVRDVTARKQAEEILNVRTRAIESTGNAIIIAKSSRDEDNPIIYVNPAFESITGYRREEVIGRNPRFLVGADWGQAEIDKLRDSLRRHQPAQVTLRNYRKDGTLFWSELSLAPVKDDQGVLTHYISVINDITDRVRYEEELQHRATHDELTGLANRVLLVDRIDQAIAHSARSDRHVAVMLLDLDRFKVINDSLGHGVGDVVVRTIGERLKTCVRRGDTVARIGGDEFVVVLAEMQVTGDASHVAWKIQEAIAHPIEVPGQQLFVTTSIGISVGPGDGSHADTLLKNADVAMYAAKEQGGSCFRFYASTMNERAIERLSLEGDLRRAVERNEFVLHYQPKLDLRSGRIVGAEALIRWRHPKRGMVSPMEFIPLAEETGLISPIGEWALRTAAERARLWQDIGLSPISVAVNISARQFRQPNLARTVRRVVESVKLDPGYLELELTESMIMQNAQQTLAALNELKGTGIRLSIDDFGTGYSSLSYLRRFPVDTLKIDRSFVKDLESSSDCRTITGTIIMLAHGLGMHVVAEGVETTDQRDFLRASDCDEIQGYLFSKPLPEDEFVQLLKKTNGPAAQGSVPEKPPLRAAVGAK